MLSILFEILTNDEMQDDASDMVRFLLKYSEMIKIKPKNWFFGSFCKFFVYTLLHPINYTPRFCQNKRPY